MKTWRYLEEDAVNADYGLATDEFLMSYYPVENPHPEPTLRLYTYYSHCALVGRFQDIRAELDLENCAQENFQIGRRPTGGGAIIMGQGQLGVCITTSTAFDRNPARPIEIYDRFSAPILHALQKMGIDAEFRSKNDLEVEQRKIAGLGVYYDTKGAILFHASLLVDLGIPLMLRALKIPAQKISDKAMIQSVEQRITTVSRELNHPTPVDEVRQRVKSSFEETLQMELKPRPVSPSEKDQVEKLAEEKYRTEAWVFQHSPQADMTGMSLKKTKVGLLRIYIGLKGETIKSILITGDFFEQAKVFNQIETQLKWCPLEMPQIEHVVAKSFSQNEDLSASLSVNDLVEAIWIAGHNAKENRFTYRGSCYYPPFKIAEAEV